MKTNDRDIFIASLITFFTAVAWISFELILTTKTTTVESAVERVIAPLNPNINIEIFDELKTRGTTGL